MLSFLKNNSEQSFSLLYFKLKTKNKDIEILISLTFKYYL